MSLGIFFTDTLPPSAHPCENVKRVVMIEKRKSNTSLASPPPFPYPYPYYREIINIQVLEIVLQFIAYIDCVKEIRKSSFQETKKVLFKKMRPHVTDVFIVICIDAVVVFYCI